MLRGMTLGGAGRGRLRLILALHAETGAPLPRATLGALGLQLALVAGIRTAFLRHAQALASALPHLITHFKSALAVRTPAPLCTPLDRDRQREKGGDGREGQRGRRGDRARVRLAGRPWFTLEDRKCRSFVIAAYL